MNRAYAQLIVLQKFKVILLITFFAVCLIFAGYVIVSNFLAFVCIFLGFIFKYVKIFLTPEMWEVYKQLIIAFL